MPKRRILLILVALLFAVDVGLYLWVKPYAASMLSRYTVKIYVVGAEHIDKVKSKLEESGHKTSQEEGVAVERMIPKGFKVFFDKNDETLLKPMLDTLKHDKIPAKIVNKQVLVGEPPHTFKQEKQAKEMLKKVAKYGFVLEENVVKSNVKVTIVSTEIEGEQTRATIRDVLADLKFVRPDDIKFIPIVPK